MALLLAVAGWLIWIFAWIAEADTGYPDGVACTGNPASSAAYASCLRSSERSGAIAWAVTLGLAVAGLTVLARALRGRAFDTAARWSTLAAGALCTMLAVAGLSVWVQGARGQFYEDRIGSTTWHFANAASVLVGLAAASIFTPRPQTDVEDREVP